MFVSHLYIFFGEMSVQVFFPLFDWVVCFSGIELYELLVYFGMWGPKWETLKKEGLALQFRAKMAPGRRDEDVA